MASAEWSMSIVMQAIHLSVDAFIFRYLSGRLYVNMISSFVRQLFSTVQPFLPPKEAGAFHTEIYFTTSNHNFLPLKWQNITDFIVRSFFNLKAGTSTATLKASFPAVRLFISRIKTYLHSTSVRKGILLCKQSRGLLRFLRVFLS